MDFRASLTQHQFAVAAEVSGHGGITFTYGGVKIDASGRVLRSDQMPIEGLFAAGEMVGGVFFEGYPGGSGLTSGAVFGRAAGTHAAKL